MKNYLFTLLKRTLIGAGGTSHQRAGFFGACIDLIEGAAGFLILFGTGLFGTGVLLSIIGHWLELF